MGFIDILASIAKFLPEVRVAEKPVSVRERIMWTAGALLIFFMMYNVTAFGLKTPAGSGDFLQVITASKLGSLLTVGIGPIVLASIFLQLFKGAGLINLDMNNQEERKKFHEAQKIFAIVLALVESSIYVYGGAVSGLLINTSPITAALVILQITLGAIVLFYLDEVITKYGIGSGISLFIAAGVSMAIVGGLFSLVFGSSNSVISNLTEGGAEAIPQALLALLPFIFTLIVFAVCVFAEGMKVEVPVAYEAARGIAPKLPLKFFYTSNVPVIFASALIMNMQFVAGPIIGFVHGFNIDFSGHNIAEYLGSLDASGRLHDGLAYLLTPIYTTGGTAGHFAFLMQTTALFNIPEWAHALVYIIFLVLCSIVFGIFWSETSGMDSKSVAGQLGSAGMQIPGFRRDPRLLEKVLDKYIGPLIIVSSASVGLLAGVADLTGALGTGTGILLTVGILYKMYEDLERMNTFDIYPQLTKMF